MMTQCYGNNSYLYTYNTSDCSGAVLGVEMLDILIKKRKYYCL